MLVRHITDFMQEQLRPAKTHTIFLVKGVQVVKSNGREVKEYDIREASLLDKAKMNLPTESSAKLRAQANIELSEALEEMRQQELIAIAKEEISDKKTFVKMGVEYLSRKNFSNITVAPDARATQLTGFDFQHLTEEQWLRFEKIEKFLHFVQKKRHIPGNLGDNTSMSGVSTASGRENWAEAVRTGEPWRLFVIRSDVQHRFTEREAHTHATVALNPDTLEVLSVAEIRKDGIDLDEQRRLDDLIPENETRRGRRNALSKDDAKAAQINRKRAVLEFEDAVIKKKDLKADLESSELFKKTSSRPPAPLPKTVAGEETPPIPVKKGSPSRVPMPPQNGCNIPDISQTADHFVSKNADGTYKARVSPTRVDRGPTIIDASSWNIVSKLKDSDENLTSFSVNEKKQSPKVILPHPIDEKRQSPQSTAPTAIVSGDIPHAIIDHVNAPVVDDKKPIIYASILGAKPEPTKPVLPQELRVEDQQVDYMQTVIIQAAKGTFKVVESDYAEIGKASPTRVVVAPVEKKVEEKPDPTAIYTAIDKVKVFADDEAPPVPESTDQKMKLQPPPVAKKPAKPVRTGDASPEKVAESAPTPPPPPPVPARKSPTLAPATPTRVQSLQPRVEQAS